jgi:hypothetical protein
MRGNALAVLFDAIAQDEIDDRFDIVGAGPEHQLFDDFWPVFDYQDADQLVDEGFRRRRNPELLPHASQAKAPDLRAGRTRGCVCRETARAPFFPPS